MNSKRDRSLPAHSTADMPDFQKGRALNARCIMLRLRYVI